MITKIDAAAGADSLPNRFVSKRAPSAAPFLLHSPIVGHGREELEEAFGAAEVADAVLVGPDHLRPRATGQRKANQRSVGQIGIHTDRPDGRTERQIDGQIDLSLIHI